jgi:hypothetical protein
MFTPLKNEKMANKRVSGLLAWVEIRVRGRFLDTPAASRLTHTRLAFFANCAILILIDIN